MERLCLHVHVSKCELSHRLSLRLFTRSVLNYLLLHPLAYEKVDDIFTKKKNPAIRWTL